VLGRMLAWVDKLAERIHGMFGDSH
jgi:hypothetical protein